ncbi:MAG TPA: SRPBCC family protein, partial [Nocardioides sp.]|nr:SRPBCC family protein [Nocardioides sp.]
MTLQAALPRELYVDPAAWVDERERVLMGEWSCVGRVADLGLQEPERVAVVEVLGESLVVTSDAHGALHAAYNVCRHRGSQLFPTEPGSQPQLCGAKSIRCPYHSWTYALDGSLLRAPHTEEGDLEPAEFGLHPVGVEAWGGFVFVHPSPATAAPLADSVGRATRTLANYDLAALVTGLTLHYDVVANWKVLAENYNECYHCGPVHPELSRLVPSFAGGGRGLDWDAGIPHREGAWTFTMSGTTDRAPLPGLDEDERTRHKGELVYPNLMLSCSADHVAA